MFYINLHRLLGLLALFAVASVHAESISVTPINQLREAAGLQPLSASTVLTQAAQAHAIYLYRYMPPGTEQQGNAHEERAGLPEFVGQFAPKRAQAFGYPHQQVIENVSLGNETAMDSIADLMSAIYHRFAFFDFEIDEMGAADAGQRYVYNMGRKSLSRACVEQPGAARLSPPYNCLGNNIQQSAIEQSCANLPEAAVFSPPFPVRCENGSMLDKAYMEQICAAPPADAVLSGAGRYIDVCGNGTKIRASWFKRACESGQPGVVYPYSGGTYKICSPEIPVYAEWYQDFCAVQTASAAYTQSGKYYNVCSNGFEINAEYYEALTAERLAAQPVAVLWPAQGVSNIKPVFYSEEPHPTPDLPMTAYPISIQFNPQKVKSVAIMGFSLEVYQPGDFGDWQAITNIRMINKSNDINQRFSEYEFAWFPLRRFDWGGRYRYRIDALVDGVFQQYSAEFETTKLKLPIYKLEGGMDSISVSSKRFILYREPDAYDALPFQSVSLRYRGRPFVEPNVIDFNTVEIRVGGRGCSPVYLSTRLGEEIEINVCKGNKWLNLF